MQRIPKSMTTHLRMRKSLGYLKELGQRPATSFYESGPSQAIENILSKLGVANWKDEYGNIIARYVKGDSDKPPIAFVAHMDHPGFEAVDVDGKRVTARVLGGIPMSALSNPVPVFILLNDGTRIPALTNPFETPAKVIKNDSERFVLLDLCAEAKIIPPLPVIFDLPDFDIVEGVIHMRAVDDLAGCAAILEVLGRLKASKAVANIYGVFTRAEEVGLYGARIIAEAKTLEKSTIIVSIESSSVIPGVTQNAGPVIRTGDATLTFDAEAEQLLLAARTSIKKRRPNFKTQRALMSGGTCEATAFALAGYRTTGVAFPLRNYHNATTSVTDPQGEVRAEYIQMSDFLDGVDLLTEVARLATTEYSGLGLPNLRPMPEEVMGRLKTN